MSATDKSWKALFKPGEDEPRYMESEEGRLVSDVGGFELNNAWWLSEFSRVTYRLDDESRNISGSADIRQLLSSRGITIKKLVTDTGTSTCAVLFQLDCLDLQGNRQLYFVLSFCGTNEGLDWKINLQAMQDNFFDSGKVHSGFLKSYLSVREKILNQLDKLNGPLFITGHSLGAALATLLCADLELQNINYDTCYTFGSPRVGDITFNENLSSARLYRVVNNCDVVTTVPVSLGHYQYIHSGFSCFIDHNKNIKMGLSEEEITSLQRNYIPALLGKLSKDYFLDKLKNFHQELPEYLADHAPINYSTKLTKAMR